MNDGFGFVPAAIGGAIRLTLSSDKRVVPLAGIEPALLAELDFESSASTSSATGATPRRKLSGAGMG
jgi:hypothetical protein